MASSELLGPPAASPPATAGLGGSVPAPAASAWRADAPPPASLAAGLLAAGRGDARLGLERLPRRRAGDRGRSLLFGAAVLLLALALGGAGLGWLRAGGFLTAGSSAPPREERPSSEPPAATRMPDLESQRAAALSAPPAATETAPGPGGLAVSIRPVESNYTVVAGDTLERIAQRFGTTVDALVGINNLGDRNSLSVGQKLIVP